MKRINGILNRLNRRKGLKAQTALEYALVVGAISLVLMFAWNQVGDTVRNAIMGDMQDRIEQNLTRGNATVER
ncbi:MAG: Flp family type IVb pilin [Bradymonadales bacterium]|nr:MAG: Flp family type IVb pilin [Bradymonadales bacterium]